MKKIEWIAVVLLLCAAESSRAQTTGMVTGYVVDNECKPIVGATIRFVGTKQGGLSKPPDGRFRIAGIRAGEYTVEIYGIRYAKVERTVRVMVDSTTDVGWIYLEPEGTPGCVMRISCRPVIRRDRVGSTRTIVSDQLDRQPGE